ncbi:hypothetical protein CEXT_412381 [Caerostris extrusa]|uniref:Uncharacterized protein n=1 Tax=Caerostris extrusa TaxID=172846 RepID=A0AAV4QZK9_CAEEX|nr:hypothetical protein CEXT_412381 [Caerostris extrusa]
MLALYLLKGDGVKLSGTNRKPIEDIATVCFLFDVICDDSRKYSPNAPRDTPSSITPTIICKKLLDVTRMTKLPAETRETKS